MEVSTTKIVETINEPIEDNLTILFWNGFWNWPFFGMGVGNRGFVANKCQYQNCYTTNQRKKLLNQHTRIDAIVVHGWDDSLNKLARTSVSIINLNRSSNESNVTCFKISLLSWQNQRFTLDLLCIYFQNFRDVLKKKNQEKYPHFVYFYKEPPGKEQDMVYKNNEQFSNLFDITYTYRRDSVIPFVYGKVIPRNDVENLNKVLQDNSISEWKPVPAKFHQSLLNTDLIHKTKGILWMVSHCTTDSLREEYVKKLQSHLPTLTIDILGKCGKDALPNSNVDGRKLCNIMIKYRNI